MTWLAILGLAIWLIVEHNRASTLARKVEELRERLMGEPATPPPTAAPVPVPGEITPAMEAAARVAADAAPGRTRPIVTAAPPPPTPEPTPAPAIAEPARPPVILRAPPPRPPPPMLTRAAVETWLAERGLAWIGGSALVVGGAFLVGYAAQRGLFGPPMRIAAAILLGLALIAVGELVRRGRLAGFGANKLVAAILSGAGAAVLYGAVWAAYALYGFLSGLACAAVLTAIVATLMGLAFVHGEALALLALGGAFLIPLIAGRREWTVEGLSLYMGLLVAFGAVVSWMRRWPAAAWTNLTGVAIWSLLSLFERETLKSLLLGLEPLAVTALLAYVRPRRMPGAVVAGAVLVASFSAWLALAMAYPGLHPWIEGLTAGLGLPLLAAALRRRGAAPSWSLIASGVGLTLAALSAREQGLQTLPLMELWCVQVLALASGGLWAAWGAQKDRMAAGAGALGALALGLVAGGGLGAGPFAPLGPGLACVALALGAARLATDRRGEADARSLDIWGGASAAALLATIAVGLSWRWAPLGFAAATVGLALLGRRLAWRSIRLGAAGAGALAFAALLTPSLLTYAVSGGPGADLLLGLAVTAAVACFVAARLVVADPVAAEALRTFSPLAVLVGAFVFLRWLAGARTGLPLDELTQSSLRTLLIAAAGLASLARIDRERSAFARWRGHALMLAAATHGLVLQALVFNPRLGVFADAEGGVVFLNVLAVAYLAPAVVFALASARIYRTHRLAGAAYAAIGLAFGLLWAFLEIRRLCHGPDLAGDALTIGAGESVADALVLLALAVLIGRVRPSGAATEAHPFRTHLGQVSDWARWIAIGFALVMAGYWSNPCWGPAGQPLGGTVALAAVLAGYGAIAGLIALLALDARRVGGGLQAELATLAAMTAGLILASLAARALFHGADLTLDSPTGQLETWSYSAVWAAVGLAFIGVSRRGGRTFQRAGVGLLLVTTGKVFIIDTASLSGVVRAGSFLALGVLLLAGALTARRVAQGAAPQPAPAPDPDAASPDGIAG